MVFTSQEPRVAAGGASKNGTFWDNTPILHRVFILVILAFCY
ncbi:hypothetical protein HDEF_1356 [Candidatus Hamiltonella defensa 5AT (Acyrthosiphon pisum)]|uniref:Uncharacterized protein n=1 Tax=Hamiltonella defensa subsp. Acyrthosiphon pisum (strain 5AT) TaxID=572265 RepID=C4K604_HAMD5|nr:hypothetical protein HDEF_1356 [Candidatus Hamiltonella defensa 5AT (Acyrthosiphon pisum)]